MQTRHHRGSTPSVKMWLSSNLDIKLAQKRNYFIAKTNLFSRSKIKIPSGKDGPVFSVCLTRRQHCTPFIMHLDRSLETAGHIKHGTSFILNFLMNISLAFENRRFFSLIAAGGSFARRNEKFQHILHLLCN